ncbi:hypothetical protein DV706_18405 (plasmid) [Natronorubrum bangense]|uniref:Transposase, IS605 OrfB family protein n=2 Tax=Natronorubrum bangense TaxID=61858 RepID=L9WBE1_9EURY|nr:hypothetical protein [Natronorubrum bangense]ELY45618.1 transposase, IS605 OrfB family protein [Natronorubrum bangense JCM 10635]QCC56483.1 hypothetical protein DV706_18405 [Natronorubrum bangense]
MHLKEISTAVIKLDTPGGADALPHETVEQFKHCANTASEWYWHGDDGYHVTSKADRRSPPKPAFNSPSPQR